MTVEEAIERLREQVAPRLSERPEIREAIAMAVTALEIWEKEKEPALQKAKTSSNNNCSIKNDNTKTKACQEVIDLVATELEFYRDQLSEEEQKAWTLGEVYRKVLDAQNLIEEATE